MCPLIIHDFIKPGAQDELWQRQWCAARNECAICKQILDEKGIKDITGWSL